MLLLLFFVLLLFARLRSLVPGTNDDGCSVLCNGEQAARRPSSPIMDIIISRGRGAAGLLPCLLASERTDS